MCSQVQSLDRVEFAVIYHHDGERVQWTMYLLTGEGV